MTSTGPLQHWVDQHPPTNHIDVARSVQRGQQSYRRWLIVRTVTAVALGIGILAVTVVMRTGGSSAALPLTAQLELQPSSGNAPLTVRADGSKSTPASGGEIASYRFDFDDRDVLAGPQEQPTAEWTYRRSGTYTVTLTITDANGALAQDSLTVAVIDRPTPSSGTSTAPVDMSKVPDLIGLRFDRARHVAKEAGFQVERQDQESRDVKPDHVVAQSPTPGSWAERDSSIALSVAVRPTTDCKVPDLVGLTYDRAKQVADGAGFGVARQDQESDEAKPDHVVAQSPEPDSLAKCNSTITLSVAVPPNPVTPTTGHS